MIDFLVVGCGFSGIAIATELGKRNYSYHIADPCELSSSTAISGALINPVSGRKYQIQWKYDELSELIKTNYALIENMLGTELISACNIIKIHKTEIAMNEWLLRSGDEELEKHIDRTNEINLPENLNAPFGHLLIKDAFRVNSQLLVSRFCEWAKQKQVMIAGKIDHDDIKIEKDYFNYAGQPYRRIIFCEGISALQNPWFQFIQFKPAKGESMIIEIPELTTDHVIHKGIILIPLGDYLFWAGATNTWNDLSTTPTEEGLTDLQNLLNDLLLCEYKIISRHAAIRPTIKDRMPVVGAHPQLPNMFMLNGMGTKGASRSWYYSKLLIDHIEQKEKIPHDVHVIRFYKFYE